MVLYTKNKKNNFSKDPNINPMKFNPPGHGGLVGYGYGNADLRKEMEKSYRQYGSAWSQAGTNPTKLMQQKQANQNKKNNMYGPTFGSFTGLTVSQDNAKGGKNYNINLKDTIKIQDSVTTKFNNQMKSDGRNLAKEGEVPGNNPRTGKQYKPGEAYAYAQQRIQEMRAQGLIGGSGAPRRADLTYDSIYSTKFGQKNQQKRNNPDPASIYGNFGKENFKMGGKKPTMDDLYMGTAQVKIDKSGKQMFDKRGQPILEWK